MPLLNFNYTALQGFPDSTEKPRQAKRPIVYYLLFQIEMLVVWSASLRSCLGQRQTFEYKKMEEKTLIIIMRDPISGLRPPPVWVEKIVTLYFGNFSSNKQDFKMVCSTKFDTDCRKKRWQFQNFWKMKHNIFTIHSLVQVAGAPLAWV